MKQTLIVAILMAFLLGVIYGLLNASADPLKDAANAKGMMIGVAVDYTKYTTDNSYKAIVDQEFNQVTFENAMKQKVIFYNSTGQDYSMADAMVTVAQAQNKKIHGHTYIWALDTATPQWLLDKESTMTKAEAIGWLYYFVTSQALHFKDKLYSADVVNEAIEESLDPAVTNVYRDCIWYRKIGPEYIELAFRFARMADPTVKLYINDYNVEINNSKSAKYLAVIQALQAKGTPIDGVGMQFHMKQYEPWNIKSMRTNMAAYNATGLEIAISELDVASNVTQLAGMASWARKDDQANKVYDVVRICRENNHCKRITWWGVYDAQTWRTGQEPLLFSDQWVRKPVITAVEDALKE